MSRTVYLHVGVAKTGTTYLQRLMYANRDLLSANGVLYPGDRPAAHFLASMDLRGSGFGGHEYPAARGMWDTFVGAANRFPGTTVISHETLARTRATVIRRAVKSFDTEDVRVVLTTRDLGRQLPAVWQENVKNRNAQTYADFLAEVLVGVPTRRKNTELPAGETASRFWRPQYLPDLVRRWTSMVGADNVILVTVPPPGAPHEELWRRFSRAVELPDLGYSFEVEGDNVSLGAAESELLRRLSTHVPEEVDWPTYEARVKRRFAEKTLAKFNTRGKVVVPTEWHETVTVISEQMVGRLENRGLQVIGDLDDLRPRFEHTDSPLPGEVSDSELLETALRVLAEVVSRPPGQPAGQGSLRMASQSFAQRLRARLRHD